MPRSAAFRMPVLTARQQDTDELGDLREQIAELVAKAKKIENRLRKCVGKEFHGNFFDSKIWETETSILSRVKLRRYLSEKQLKACYVPGETRVTVKTVRRE